jgi:hypothetical protein
MDLAGDYSGMRQTAWARTLTSPSLRVAPLTRPSPRETIQVGSARDEERVEVEDRVLRARPHEHRALRAGRGYGMVEARLDRAEVALNSHEPTGLRRLSRLAIAIRRVGAAGRIVAARDEERGRCGDPGQKGKAGLPHVRLSKRSGAG